VIVGFGGFVSLVALSSALEPAQNNDIAQHWDTWSPRAVMDAQRDGRPILLDFTAAWCVTCLINERVARENEVVAEQAAKHKDTLTALDKAERNPDPDR
jgi:thiol:disulfide interchange protein DsbD